MEVVTENDTNATSGFTTGPNNTDIYEQNITTNGSENVNYSNFMFYHKENQFSTYFEVFVIFEIVMTAIEIIISSIAALKISRWRKNYRNQMIMQLSFARFIKRVIFFIEYMKSNHGTELSETAKKILFSVQIYIDFVIVILVCFFIKHMYESLIIVIVKISKNNLYIVLCWSWILPIPLTVMWMAIILTKVLEEWTVYFLICVLIRWPLIFVGTIFYFIILYKVLKDEIRQFARSLTIITFLLCLVINFYLFSKDIIKLWCTQFFIAILSSYVSGLILNFLILSFYVILIFMNFKSNLRASKSLPEFSTANVMK